MGRLFTKSGFQQRVVTNILLVGMVSVAFGLLSVYFFGRAALEKTIGDTYAKLAEVTATNLEKEIGRHAEEARVLSLANVIVQVVAESNISYEGLPTKEVERQLRTVEERWSQQQGVDAYLHAVLTNSATEYLKRFDNHDADHTGHMVIMAVDAHGAVVAATRRPDHYDFSASAWWRTTMASGNTFFSDIERSEAENTYTFSVAYPIRNRDRVIGVLYMRHDAPSLFRVVTDVKVAQTAHTMLVSSDGLILFCPVLPIKSHNLAPHLQTLVLKESSGWVASVEDVHYPGRLAINGFSPVTFTFGSGTENFGGKQWYVVTSQDPGEAFAPIYDLLKWVALTGLLGAIIIAVMGSIVARRIIQPIRVLQDGVERIAAGNLDHTIRVDTKDEIADLATAFNQMGEKLKASYSGLEAKIAERTRELETKNRELYALYTIVSTINRAAPTPAGYTDALTKIMVTLRIDAISLSILSGDNRTARYGAPKELAATALRALDTLDKSLIDSGETSPLIIEDLRGNPRYNLLERDLGHLGVTCVPVMGKARQVGMLHLLNREPRLYTSTERTLIQSIANQLGTSIDALNASKNPA
ncbi:MAG: cache domain-containing protein [Nitrospirota bacterium]|nr:cache domain-containing protein [Nitrospirota bacterium]